MFFIIAALGPTYTLFLGLSPTFRLGSSALTIVFFSFFLLDISSNSSVIPPLLWVLTVVRHCSLLGVKAPAVVRH